VRLPRDVSGQQLVGLLRRRYGYAIIRQTGSHMQLASDYTGEIHRITIPSHRPLRIGTLSAILFDVAEYLGLTREELTTELFGR
jgi:predicted RNA binding protein YcfA (HicA-like mRNA interferase family)